MLQRSRILAITTLRAILLLFLGLISCLFFIQVIHADKHAERIRKYQLKGIQVQVPRGTVFDMGGEVLAASIPALEVWAFNRYVDNPRTPECEAEVKAHLLAPLLKKSPAEITAIFSRTGYCPLHRKITDPDTILELFLLKRSGKLRGIDLVKRYDRTYPHGEMLGHVLGFVNHEEKGVFGLERLQDDFLQGWPGRRVFRKDGAQNEIFTREEDPVRGAPGGDVYLTVDSSIQLFAELELAKIDTLYRPQWAAAVVLEPATGRVLAAAGLPALNPTDPSAGKRNEEGVALHWIDRTFSAQYTPGSSFKPLVMAMALDRGVVGLNESFDCEGGLWSYHGRIIKDVHRDYDYLDPAGILIHSSNVGMSKIALRLVPQDTPKGGEAFKPIRDTLALLGFGRCPNVLPSSQESPGQVTKLEDWSRKYTQVSISFGNEIAVTPIQMAAAFGALVNDGVYVPPRLIERMVSSDGRETTAPMAPRRRVFSAATSRAVREMLVRVVDEGTVKISRIPGYSVGGKTGTAEKLPAKTEVTASFVAFSPAEKPRLLVLVVVDEPQGAHYGSKVAAPHVRAILERGLSHLGIGCQGREDRGLERES